MKNIGALQEIIKTRFEEYYLNISATPDELYEPVRYILSIGGKRLRPVLVLMGCMLFDDDFEKAIIPSLAMEVFHNFTLIHDDIMDKADMRRGKPTVHKKWSENVAILSGDAALVEAYKLIAKSPADKLPETLSIFNNTAIEVCEGQQYDMNFETDEQVDVKEYLEMIRLKTSVLIAACCKIGAVIGGAKQEDADLLYEFGQNLGLAFQLQDDLLDVYGDPKVFGKKIGGDILANKKTYLMIKALELSTNEKRKELQQLITDTKITDNEKIRRVTEIYNEAKVSEAAKNRIEDFYQKAIAALQKISVADERKKGFNEFAANLMKRDK